MSVFLKGFRSKRLLYFLPYVLLQNEITIATSTKWLSLQVKGVQIVERHHHQPQTIIQVLDVQFRHQVLECQIHHQACQVKIWALKGKKAWWEKWHSVLKNCCYVKIEENNIYIQRNMKPHFLCFAISLIDGEGRAIRCKKDTEIVSSLVSIQKCVFRKRKARKECWSNNNSVRKKVVYCSAVNCKYVLNCITLMMEIWW